MAKKSKLGLQAFTVQEANNYEAYDHWYFQNVDVSGDSVDDGVDSLYITDLNPAKKVVIFDSIDVSVSSIAFDTFEYLKILSNFCKLVELKEMG